MTKPITKAIIPVAGWGARRLPVTKAIEKCMLPVGNRPIVDYVVQDCIKAGITDIYFVVGEDSEQLRTFYRPNTDLEDYLKRNNKHHLLPLIETPKADFHFIVQPSYGKYGTAVPVAMALAALDEGESALVVMGDDYLFNETGPSDIERLVLETPQSENGILGIVNIEDRMIKVGYIMSDDAGYASDIIEHPEIEPPRFVKNVSKYVLNYQMIQAIAGYVETATPSGEYQIFAPFAEMIQNGQKLKLTEARGDYLDAGTFDGWLHANNYIAKYINS